MKKIFSLGVLFMSLIVLSAVAFALPISIDEVEIDNDEIFDTSVTTKPNILDLERGQEIDVKVRITGLNPTAGDDSLDNVQIEARMRGSDFKELIEDITDTFNVKEGVSYIKRLKLRLPDRLEQDEFWLRISVDSRSGSSTEKDYRILVSADRHQITIKDIILNPENEVKAGRTLLASLRLKNMGQKDEKGVKVKVSIPELGVSASDFVNEVEAENRDDDQATSNELFLRIPKDAKTGVYTVVAEAIFRDGDESVKKETEIRVIEEEETPAVPVKKDEKTVINVPTVKQALTAGGAELFYPVTITNLGSESKAYTITVEGVAWGATRVSPSNFDIVSSQDSKTFNVHVKANQNAPAGEQMFLVNVKSGDKVLQQIPLTAMIASQQVGGGFKLTNVLEVLAIVLVVLIIIILLVFGLSRVTRKDNEEEKEDESYY